MRIALFGDIHANLEALEAVLEDASKQGATDYVCMGDVVGYNANPKECLDIVRAMNMPCVKGNHDEYCSSEEDLEGFNPHAAEAVECGLWVPQEVPSAELPARFGYVRSPAQAQKKRTNQSMLR